MNAIPRILAVDTSTRSSVVVVGDDRAHGSSSRQVQHRHGAHLLDQIDAVLAEAGWTLDDVSATAVGTGPGSFTGLRVGMATVKTIAYARGLPLIGIPSSDALRHAVAAAGGPGDAAIVLPAGARDHYLAAPGADPVLVAPGEVYATLGGRPVVTIDQDPAALGDDAARLGSAAVDGLADSLLSLAREGLANRLLDDVAELVPAYVALPRGVARAAEELGWSPDLR